MSGCEQHFKLNDEVVEHKVKIEQIRIDIGGISEKFQRYEDQMIGCIEEIRNNINELKLCFNSSAIKTENKVLKWAVYILAAAGGFDILKESVRFLK